MASPSRSEGTAPMVPLRLTDAQLDTLHRLSWPLARVDRGPFLEAVAVELAKHPELLGDGHIARVGVEVQRRFWTPPGPENRREAHVGEEGRRGPAPAPRVCGSHPVASHPQFGGHPAQP